MKLYTEILLKGLKTTKENIKPTFDAFFIEKEPQIRYLIYTRWLLGKRPDGRSIGVYFSEDYREYKYFKNPLAGASVDLIDTGSLWKHIEIFNESDGIEIISTDEKFEKIIDKYGSDNFNITDAQEEEIINEISIKTIEYLYKKYVL
jgi:hypothetical protein